MHISATNVLVFFGVLAAALVLGTALIVRAVLRAAAIKRRGYVLEPRPGDIQDAIQAAPIMQQSRARRAYLGLGVRWHVTFDPVIVLNPLSVRVMGEGQGSAVWVFGDVHLRDYPRQKEQQAGMAKSLTVPK